MGNRTSEQRIESQVKAILTQHRKKVLSAESRRKAVEDAADLDFRYDPKLGRLVLFRIQDGKEIVLSASGDQDVISLRK